MTNRRPETSTRKPICVHIEHAKQGNETLAMSDPGWVQPAAHIDAYIAVILAAADHTQTFEDLLSAKDRDTFINWLDDHED